MIWNLEYKESQSNIEVEGYSILAVECRAFMANQVSTKLIESDSAEQLRTHLTELEATGFDSSGLLTQMTEAAWQVKDWEVGEAIATTILEDEHGAMFPWETGWDKRNTKASLPGADIVGFQNKSEPRFIFGQVKSSSESRVPPQVINSSNDCLSCQMCRLAHVSTERIQLIQWLLLRVKGTSWESAFNEALERYTKDNFLLIGMLISGGRDAKPRDLTSICADIQCEERIGEISLLGYYLPFRKDSWASLVHVGG